MSPIEIELPTEAVDVSFGVSHSVVVTAVGDVYTAGLGQEGQLGFQCDSYIHLHKVEFFSGANAALKACCGDCYTIVLTNGHQVYSFGKGAHGRLGLGDDENRFDPSHIVRLANEEVVDICAGCRHAGAVTRSGRLFTWGFNFYEQLGVGEGDYDLNSPTQVRSVTNVEKIAFGYFHSGVLISET